MKAVKGYRNFLACLLAVLMIVTTLLPPVAAETEEIERINKKAVFSIDAGRKYFSVEELESLIDKASECGYTDFQLILGNDGLRFILDDMTVVTENGIYDGNLVREAIAEGNDDYYEDEDGNYLTEAEMNEILAFAKEKGIKIIPLINSPGHMDSILYAMEKLGIEEPNYNGSIRTVDLENMEAVTFTRLLLNKYMEYFSGQCEIFNLGCDEYANDIDNGGWKKLQRTGKYEEFIEYVNTLATDVKEYGMEPMCFNDGIYYSNDDRFGEFDKDLIISYWHNGWIGYNPASAEYLADKGHRILNTNNRWYWVVGNFRKRDHGNEYTYRKAEDGAKHIRFNSVPGGGNVPTIGSMQCVWYDYPENEYDHNLVINLMELFKENNSEYMCFSEKETEVINKTDEDEGKEEVKNIKRSVISIDAGNEYFSKENLIEIIEKAYKCGYTDVELILGNGSLRFLPDNMAVGKYSSEQVKEGIIKGNSNCYKDPKGDYLTEAEMTEIVEYAKERDIGIIPMIDSPGHMNSIIGAMKYLGIKNPDYNQSGGTVDLENKEAVKFTRDLINLYINWFSKTGNCEIFNLGCDEYANEAGIVGWDRLQKEGKYGLFVDYVNTLANDVKQAGLEPMAFNDGIYYKEKDEYGTFDKDIIISYWTKGWYGKKAYRVAQPAYLVDKGHRILNTNDGWYWVLGNFSYGKTKNKYTYLHARLKTRFLNFNDVPGGKNIPTIGSMQCIWTGQPYGKTDQPRILYLMDQFAKKNSEFMKGTVNKENEEKVNEPKTEEKVTNRKKPSIKSFFEKLKAKKKGKDKSKSNVSIEEKKEDNIVRKEDKGPETGDLYNPILWVAILGGATVIIIVLKKKRKKE